MNSAVAVLCCYYISCASGVSDLENNLQITIVTNTPEEEFRFKNSTNPINETELYAGEQAEKKNDQRSTHVVLNHRFKSHFIEGKSLPIKNHNPALRTEQKNRVRNNHVQPTTYRQRHHERKHNYATKYERCPKNKLARLAPISYIGKTKINSGISQKSIHTLFNLRPVGSRLSARWHTTRKPAARHYIRVPASPKPPLAWNNCRNQKAKSLPQNSAQRDYNVGKAILGNYIRNTEKLDKTKTRSNFKRYTCYNINCKTNIKSNKHRSNNGIRKNSLCVCDDDTAQDNQSKEGEDKHREVLDQIMKDLTDLAQKNEIKRKLD